MVDLGALDETNKKLKRNFNSVSKTVSSLESTQSQVDANQHSALAIIDFLTQKINLHKNLHQQVVSYYC